jgi:3-hydroxyisobutyrate dehydrogenase-like beta-hydroxyacid dehydrogenase
VVVNPIRTVALLGLGRMGAPMAARLVHAGFRVRAWNRSPAGARRLTAELDLLGEPSTAELAATAADAVSGADLVLTVLADGPALTAVLTDIAGALAPGTVLCDLGTIGEPAVRAATGLLGPHGVSFVDSPVSGSVPAVRAGTLLVLAGGPAAAVERARPALAAFADRVLRVGGSGSGQAMKLAVNSALHALNAAVSESLVLAERGGVPRETALEVLAGSAVGAPFVRYKRAAFTEPRAHPPAFTVDLMCKDLDLVLAFARDLGTPAPVAEAVRAVSGRAVAAGLGADDMSVLAELHRTTT